MGFMCDQCKKDYRTACDDPRRPNVKWEDKCKNYQWIHADDSMPSSELTREEKQKNDSLTGIDYDALAKEMGGCEGYFEENEGEQEDK